MADTITTEGGQTATVVQAPAGLVAPVREIPSNNTPVPTGNERVPKSPSVVPDFSKMEDMSIDDDLGDSVDEIVDTKLDDQNRGKSAAAPVKPTTATPQVQDTKAAEIEAKVEEEQKKVEAVKPEPKKDNLSDIRPKAKVEKGKEGTTPQQRDYTGYSPEEQTILKQMSNPAFEFTTKLMKDVKDLSGLKDAHYLQHPDGYMLTPEYRQLALDSYRSNMEGQLWQQQLLAIRDGKEWTPITGWSKDGQPIFGQKQQPTTQAEEEVRRCMNTCIQIQQQTEGKMQVLPQQYQQRRTQDTKNADSYMQNMFSWERDKSILDSPAPMGDGTERPIKQMLNDITSMFPSYERNSIGVRAAANAVVALKIYAARITELESQLQVAQTKTQEVQRGEPTSAVKPPSKNGHKVNGKVGVFDMAGLPD